MKTLKDTNPIAFVEWMDKNNKNVNEVSYGSKYKAWFKCIKCGYEWETSVDNRSKGKGCPNCVNKIVNDKNRLSTVCPDLIKDWDPSNEKSPDDYMCGSNAKVKWICHKCGFKWEAIIVDRSKGHGCRFCAGQVVNDYNRLSKLCKRALSDWDYYKNSSLPSDFAYKSNKRVFWKCKKCDYEWKTAIYNYTKSKGCPKCSGFVPNETNCLSNDEFLIGFYNDTISPQNIHHKSSKKLKWKCKACGHSWKMSPHIFSSYRGCPNCGVGSKISKIALSWLKSIDKNAIPEQKIYIDGKYIYVDGYNSKNNIVYEFLGDYWHGNPKIYSPEDINATNKIKFGTLYKDTIERLEKIKTKYKLIYIWENDWRNK